MDDTLFVVLEAHAHCATLYLNGELGAAALLRAVKLCTSIPADVTDLRVDARRLALDDAAAHAGLSASVTISLHDRAGPETRSGQFSCDHTHVEATLA